MPNKAKGTYGAECFTTDCQNTAQGIPLTVPSRYPDYNDRYRCGECCDLINTAQDYLPGVDPAAIISADLWESHIRTVLELPKAALRATATAATTTETWSATGYTTGRVTELPAEIYRDAARITSNSQPDQPMITTRELLALFDRLTKSQTEVHEVLAVLDALNTETLSDAQGLIFHRLANEYGNNALTYLTHNHSDYDRTMADPGLLLIQTATTAAERWHSLGMPRGHIADHSLYLVARTAVAALTCVYIEQGHIEAGERLDQLRRR